MRREARTGLAVFGGAAMLVTAIGCGGGNKGPEHQHDIDNDPVDQRDAVHRAGPRQSHHPRDWWWRLRRHVCGGNP